MTIVPMYKTCPKCHKKFSWNPDVGRFKCPHCGGLGKPEGGVLRSIFGKKKSKEE